MRLSFPFTLRKNLLSFLPTLVKPTTTSTPMKTYSLSTGNQEGYRQKDKVVVIMGPTGSGKSRLSVDLANRFPGEIINSDKIQVYRGLDITTNKIPLEERHGVPHHLLGEIDSPSHGEFTPTDFRARASHVLSGIISRGKVPFIVGGSNSFIYALLAQSYTPDSDVFAELDSVICSELRYNCCFIWVDVSLPVLNSYLNKRVDEMIDSGIVDELAQYYDSGELADSPGLRNAIGVPELERYFSGKWTYKEAVQEIKENTCRLAKRQMEKIKRLRIGGWRIHRIDGTDTFREVLEGRKSWADVWERQVLKQSMKIVKSFLDDE
ncbi:adenylate isopentenyltransferase 1, chloroplastic-like [Silene latifolia]|uniref:adenylate isopentenyltransferase 1, chloroplastic-like n=1 Tax=Silene latifolia TaxID=37657 RepID=UPI003D781E47